jgi:NADH:ubiquinone oxidoreductase subunit 5 (subunit L)/multisubunit Na+/H+ antiporter MnhA subunit
VSEPDAERRFFANVLMAIGGLMMFLCGGCTLFFYMNEILSILSFFLHRGPSSFQDRELVGNAEIFAIVTTVVGGIPTAVGVTLFFVGRRMKRRVTPPEPREIDNIFS